MNQNQHQNQFPREFYPGRQQYQQHHLQQQQQQQQQHLQHPHQQPFIEVNQNGRFNFPMEQQHPPPYYSNPNSPSIQGPQNFYGANSPNYLVKNQPIQQQRSIFFFFLRK